MIIEADRATPMHAVDFVVEVRQNAKITQVVLHADNDPPVILFEYDRQLALGANELTLVSVDGDAHPDIPRYIGIVSRFGIIGQVRK